MVNNSNKLVSEQLINSNHSGLLIFMSYCMIGGRSVTRVQWLIQETSTSFDGKSALFKPSGGGKSAVAWLISPLEVTSFSLRLPAARAAHKVCDPQWWGFPLTNFATPILTILILITSTYFNHPQPHPASTSYAQPHPATSYAQQLPS